MNFENVILIIQFIEMIYEDICNFYGCFKN
jgi:hypothetical protein